MNFQRLALCVAVASVLTFGAARPAWAVRQPIPDTVFDFDVTVGFSPFDGLLDPADRSHIQRSHLLALQQVSLAISYLETNRDDILAGTNGWYNQNFGRFYDRTNPNFLNGDYDLFVDAVEASDVVAVGTTVTAAGFQINFANPDYTGYFEVGDQIVIDGQVRTILGITTRAQTEDINMLGRSPKQFQPIDYEDPEDNPTSEFLAFQFFGTNHIAPDPLVDEDTTFGYPDLTSITLDRAIGLNTTNLSVRRVQRSLTTFNEGHLDQVVETFERIREVLEQPAIYLGDANLGVYDTAFNAIFANGGGTFSIAGQPVELDRRYAGLSNSDSVENNSVPGLFFGTFRGPLLWSDDLGTFRNAAGNLVEATDPIGTSPFIREFLEVLGRVAGGTVEFVLGDGFLDEEMRIPADVPAFQVGLDDGSSDDQFGFGGNPHPFRQAELQGYQQIIAAAAEMSGLAGFGVVERLENAGIEDGFLTLQDGSVIAINPFPANRDARAFGKFADVFDVQGIGDGTTGVPPGKQGAAVKDAFGGPPKPPGNIIVPQG